jgi:hypothetical protein
LFWQNYMDAKLVCQTVRVALILRNQWPNTLVSLHTPHYGVCRSFHQLREFLSNHSAFYSQLRNQPLIVN